MTGPSVPDSTKPPTAPMKGVVGKTTKAQIFFLQFEATPRRDNPRDGDVDGAFVNCWIEASNAEDAEVIARSGIVCQGWIVGGADAAYSVDRLHYRGSRGKGLEYYEQALREK